jgi:hypothetical protein
VNDRLTALPRNRRERSDPSVGTAVPRPDPRRGLPGNSPPLPPAVDEPSPAPLEAGCPPGWLRRWRFSGRLLLLEPLREHAPGRIQDVEGRHRVDPAVEHLVPGSYLDPFPPREAACVPGHALLGSELGEVPWVIRLVDGEVAGAGTILLSLELGPPLRPGFRRLSRAADVLQGLRNQAMCASVASAHPQL